MLVAATGEPLGEAIDACARLALIAPKSQVDALRLFALPERLVALLAREGHERSALAANWEAVMLADVATIPNPRARELETTRWTGACITILETLGPWVRRRSSGQSVFLLVTV